MSGQIVTTAVVFDEYGPPEVLHLADVRLPAVDADQVRLEVRAAGVQPFDAAFRRGDTEAWLPATFPGQQLGNEIAGVVAEVGADVTEPAVGDEVLGWATLQAYAEQAIVPARRLVAKPAAMSWAEAGALGGSAQTASTVLQALGVGPGETLLVHAAGGGVGSFAVQLARARGSSVVGTASARNHDYVRSLGATPVSYGDGLADRVRAAADGGVDAAIDAVGTDEALRTSIELVTQRDRIATIAALDRAAEFGIQGLSGKNSRTRMVELVDLYRQGRLRVHVDDTFALADVVAAHGRIETGHTRGKITLLPA